MYRKKTNELFNILYLLSNEKELSQKEIKNLTNLPYTQIVRDLGTLEKKRMIKCRIVSGREQNRRGPASNFWAITQWGLFNVLRDNKDKETLKKIAKKHEAKLFIFSRIELFEKIGVVDKMIQHLSDLLGNLKNLYAISPNLDDGDLDNIGRAILDTLLVVDIFPLICLNNPQAEEIKGLLKSDLKLSDYIASYLQEECKVTKDRLDLLQNIASHWVDKKR